MRIKKFISLLVAGVSVLSQFPFNGYANAAENEPAESSESLSSSITVGSSSAIGDILASRAQAVFSNTTKNSGYGVYSAETEDNIAKVTFDAPSDCRLLVCVYDDEGSQLIASGTSDVNAGDTEADVKIMIPAMPDSFLLRAYLIEKDSLAPLSTVYENPNYTKDMKRFFEQTVLDFEPERVLNLDEKPDDNFAVYNSDVIVIPYTSSTNIIQNNDGEVIVIASPDESVSSIRKGDVVSIETEQNQPLIFRAGEINEDNGTVSITQEAVDVGDIFDYVKIDFEPDDAVPQYSTEGIDNVLYSDFTGVGEDSPAPEPLPAPSAKTASDTSVSGSWDGYLEPEPHSITVGCKREVKVKMTKSTSEKLDTGGKRPENQPNVSLNASFEGYLSVTNDISLKFYFKSEYDDNGKEKMDDPESEGVLSFGKKLGDLEYFEIKFTDTIAADLSFSTSVSAAIPLFTMYVFIYGFEIKIMPTLNVSISASGRLNMSYTQVKGIRVKDCKATDISEKKKPKISTNLTGSISFGIDLNPSVSFINERILSVKLTIAADFKVTISKAGGNACDQTLDGKSDVHECYIDGTIPPNISRVTTASSTSETDTDGSTTTVAATETPPEKRGEGCCEGTIDLVFTVGIKLIILKKTKADLSMPFTWHIGNLYYSEKHQQGGLGVCPHKQYQATLDIKGPDGGQLSGAVVTVTHPDGSTYETSSDENGKASVLLCSGKNTISVSHIKCRDYSTVVKLSSVLEKTDYKTSHDLGLNITDEIGIKLNFSENKAGGGIEVKETSNASASTTATTTTTSTSKKGSDLSLSYKFAIESPTYTEKVYLNNKETRSIDVKTYAASHPLTIHVHDLAGKDILMAEVECKGEKKRTDVNGKCTFYLTNGSYDVTVSEATIGSKTINTEVYDGAASYDVELDGVIDESSIVPGMTVSGGVLSGKCDEHIKYTIENGVLTLAPEKGYSELYLKDDIFFGRAVTSVIIKDGITGISSGSGFKNCRSLKSVFLPAGMSYITDDAFNGCTSLEEINVEEGGKNYLSIDGILYEYLEKGLSLIKYPAASPAKNYTMPAEVKYLGSYAFSEDVQTEIITLADLSAQDALTVVSAMPELRYITVAENAISIKAYNGALYAKSTSKLLKVPPKMEGSLVIDSNTGSADSGAFSPCSISELTIPLSPLRYEGAFHSECPSITKVNITKSSSSDSVTKPNLENLTSLETLNIGEGFHAIGNDALSGLHFKNITLPDSLRKIGSYAFEHCDITSVALPSGLESIGTGAFASCRELRYITIPSEIKEIPEYAFRGCSSLSSVNIPASVDSIADNAFVGCSNIEKAMVPGRFDISYLEYSGGSLTSLTLLYGGTENESLSSDSTSSRRYNGRYTSEVKQLPAVFTALRSVTVGEGFTEIPDSFFAGFSYVTDWKLPSSTEKIGDSAFAYCTGFTDLSGLDKLEAIGDNAFCGSGLKELPALPSLVSIGECAFKDCDFEEVSVPGTLTYLGEKAFSSCTSLRKAEIAATLDTVTYPFSGCTSLTDLYISSSGAPEFRLDDVENIHIGSSLTQYINSGRTANFTVDAGNPSLASDNGSLYNKDMTVLIRYPSLSEAVSYNFPDSVSEFKKGAFDESINLRTLEIPDSVKSFSDISGCNALEKLRLPLRTNGVDVHLKGCTSLKELSVPSTYFSGTPDNDSSWSGSSALTMTVRAEGSKIVKGNIRFKGTLILEDGMTDMSSPLSPGITRIVIPSSVKTIGKYSDRVGALSNCPDLETIELHSGLQEIFKDSFKFCNSLKELDISCDKLSIGENCFSGCRNIAAISTKGNISFGKGCFSNCSSLKSISIGEGSTALADSMFRNCGSVQKISLPSTLTDVGTDSISGFSQLRSIDLAEGNRAFKLIDGALYDAAVSALIVYPAKGARTYCMPDSVTTIRSGAITENAGLRSVTLGRSLPLKYSGLSVTNGFSELHQFFDNYNITEIKSESGHYSVRDGFVYYDGITSLDGKTLIGCPVNRPGEIYTLPVDLTTFKSDIKYIDFTNEKPLRNLKTLVIPFTGCNITKLPDGLGEIIIFDPDCNISDSEKAISADTVIVSSTGSNAQAYAKKYGRSFVDINDYGKEIPLETTASEPVTTTTVTSPAKTIVSGDAGENAHFIYDPSDASLTVSGSGHAVLGDHLGFRLEDVEILKVKDGITSLTNGTYLKDNSQYGGGLFYYKVFCFTKLKKAELPDSLETFSDTFFDNTECLRNIELPGGISDICLFKNSGIVEIDIPSSVDKLPDNAFSGCKELRKVIFHKTYDLSSYKQLFRQCPELRCFELAEDFPAGADISKIVDAFPALNEILINENNSSYCIENGVIYSADMTELVYLCPGISELDLPATVTKLSSGALKHSTINSVKYHRNNNYRIGDSLNFTGVSNLTLASDYTDTTFPSLPVESYRVESGNEIYWDYDGVIYNDEGIAAYPQLKKSKSLSVPEGSATLSLKSNAIRNLVLPRSMKSISGKKVVLDLSSDFNLIVYSNDCEIDSLYSPYLTIYAYEGSKAAEYAYDYNIRFVSLGSSAEAIPISDEDEPYLSYLPDTDEGFTETPQRKPLRSETLSGLEPDTTYNLYVMKQEAEGIGSDNLIYVCQKSSSHDGDLSFEYTAEGETSAPCIKAVPCSDAAQFALSASKTLLFAGETAPISANRNNVTLYSSDESIAALSENGGLTAIQPGDVTIIGVDSHGNIAELAVTVTAPLGYITDDDGYYTELDDMYISTGETRSIGTFREGMLFVSSDDETASVNEHGEVKALRKGDASITVTDANGDSAVINVHVHEPIISGMTITLLEDSSWTIGRLSQDDSFTSNNPSIASVDTEGIVKAVNSGDTYITVKTPDGSAERINISVLPALRLDENFMRLCTGESFRITANRTELTYSSSAPETADVSSSGIITVLAPGTAFITATDEYGSSDVIEIDAVTAETSTAETTAVTTTESSASTTTETTSVSSTSSSTETTTTESSTSDTDTPVTTTTVVPGDANEDGSIDLKDVVIMRRTLSGGWDKTANEKNSDVNGDGSFDLKDVVYLRRYLSGGWGIELKAAPAEVTQPGDTDDGGLAVPDYVDALAEKPKYQYSFLE